MQYILLLILFFSTTQITLSSPTAAIAETKADEQEPKELQGPDLTPSISYLATINTDNSEGFGVIDIQAGITPAVTLEMPEIDQSLTQLTPEESAAKIAQGEQEKATALGAETKKEEEKTAVVKKETDLFEYNLTGLKEAGIDISKNGFGITGKIDFGIGAARLSLSVNTDGFFGQTYVKEVKVGPLLTISGTGPDGKYGTADDGVLLEIKINQAIQKIRYSGLAELLGAMSATDITIGTQECSYYSRTNLFGIFNTVFFAAFKLGDPDFLIFAALESKLMKYIEDAAVEAVSAAGNAIADVSKKAQKEVEDARREVKKLKQTIGSLQKDLDKAQKNYFDNLNKAQKEVDAAVHAVEKANANLARSLKAILGARDDVMARKKKLDNAISKVNSLTDEVQYAKRKLRKIAKGMKWYEFWKVGELTYWSIRLSGTEVARGIAVAALELVKAAITTTAGLITGVYGVAYASGEVALKAAYGTLQAALVAANPETIDDFGEILQYSVALNSTKMSYYTAQGTLISANGMFEATKQIGKGFAIAASEAIKATLGIFRIDGGGFKCALSDLKKGCLDLYLAATVFGVRKNLKLVLDMKHPDKTLVSIGKMIGDIFNPTISGGANMMDEVEKARKKFTGELEQLETKKIAVAEEKTVLDEKQKKREEALKKINADHQQRLAAMKAAFPLTAEDIQNMGDMSFITGDAALSVVDEKNPVSYTVGNMNNTFRWLEKWKLPAAQNGSVIFDVLGSEEVHIGFHHTITEKDQTTNKDCDIILGAQENSCSLIRARDNAVLFTTGDPDNLLKPGTEGTIQSYWVSLYNGCITVGRGRTPGQQILFNWQLSDLPSDTGYFSFSTAKNRVSILNIATGPACTIPFGSQYSTFNGFNLFSWPFKLPAINNGTILFKARASEHLAIGLTDNPNTKFPRYIGVIGAESNSKVTLATTSPNGKIFAYQAISEDPEGLLPKATTYKQYWATFDNGNFTLGTGDDPSENIILEMQADAATLGASVIEGEATTPPPAPTDPSTPPTLLPGNACPIQYFSFSSWDSPVEIRDIIIKPAVPISPGSKYSAVNKKYACSWKSHWQLPATGKGIILWQAKGASDMSIALHTNGTSNETTYTYLCIIGKDKNSRTILQDSTQKVLTENSDLQALIRTKNSYTPYWLAYDTGTLLLGTGTEPGKNTTLEYHGEGAPITHFSFTNNLGYTEFTKITTQPIITPLPTGKQYTALPQSPINYDPAWTLPDTTTASLRCLAKASAGFTFGVKDTTGAEYTLALDTPETIAKAFTDPFNFYPYWITYKKDTGILSCGLGIAPGKDVLASATLDNKPTLTQYGIGNPTKTPVMVKKFKAYNAQNPVNPEEYSTQEGYTAPLTATPQYSWREIWKMTEAETAAITLSTRTPDSALIGLGNKETGPIYEIIISKTEVVIKKKGAVVARTSNPDACLKTEDTLQEYYINYYKGHIALATGQNLKTDLVVEWVDTAPEKGITHASFTGNGTIFENITIKNGAKLAFYQVYSADKERGVFNWLPSWTFAKPEKTAITFEVKTGGNPLIGFASTKEAVYTISIGPKTTITKQGTIVAVNDNADLEQDGESYSPYWVIFDRGYMSVGTGTTPSTESLILEYQGIITADIMQRFSLSSTTEQATYRAVKIDSISGAQLKRNTNLIAASQKKNYTFNNQWTFPEKNKVSITVEIHGEGPYFIGLDNKIITTTNPEYEVIIGAEKNTATHIRKKGVVVAKTTIPAALINIADASTTYWITYNEGRISAGIGNTPGKKTFIDWIDSATGDITSLSFSSDTSTVRYKKIALMPAVKQEKSTEYLVPAALGKYKYDPNWRLTTANFGGVQVKAQGKNDICIGLNNGTSGPPQYEIIIGTDKNSRSVIKANGTIVAATENPEALIKNEYVPTNYWVLYDHGTICIGKDDTPGKEILLFWRDETNGDKNIINYYGFSSNDTMITYKNITTIPGVSFAPNSMLSSYQRKGAFTWNPAWRIKPGETVTFDLTAPKGEALIGFNTLSNGLPKYTLSLGGWQNTKSAVFKGDSVAEKYDLTLKPITKKLWITYQPDGFSVGTGDPHSKELFTWKNPEPDSTIGFFSLSCDTTAVSYENIKVLPAQPIQKPKVSATVKGIEISAVPKEDAADTLITDPKDPRYVSPTVAALLTQDLSLPEPSAPAALPEPATPIDSMAFLKTVKDEEITEVKVVVTPPESTTEKPEPAITDSTALLTDSV